MLDLLVRYRKYSVLAIVVVAALALLSLQGGSAADRQWVAEGIAAVTAPVQGVVTRVHRAAVETWVGYLGWKARRAEVARLRSEVVALRLRQLRHDELESENERLRAALALRERLPTRSVGAEVVARDWNGFTRGLTIDRGRADGVERLAPVIVTRGVVGRVAGLRERSAAVQLLTDPASSIGGVVVRTRAQGLVEGVAGGRLRLKLAASEEGVRSGDLVVTSGVGQLFPKGLPLGRVGRVYASSGLFRTAEIEPAVDLATVEEVLVLPRGSIADLGGAFPEG